MIWLQLKFCFFFFLVFFSLSLPPSSFSFITNFSSISTHPKSNMLELHPSPAFLPSSNEWISICFASCFACLNAFFHIYLFDSVCACVILCTYARLLCLHFDHLCFILSPPSPLLPPLQHPPKIQCNLDLMHGCTTVYNEVQSPISAKSNTPPGRDKLTLQLDGGKAQPRLRTRHRSSVDVSDSGELCIFWYHTNETANRESFTNILLLFFFDCILVIFLIVFYDYFKEQQLETIFAIFLQIPFFQINTSAQAKVKTRQIQPLPCNYYCYKSFNPIIIPYLPIRSNYYLSSASLHILPILLHRDQCTYLHSISGMKLHSTAS